MLYKDSEAIQSYAQACFQEPVSGLKNTNGKTG